MSYVRVSILGTTVGGEVWSVNPVFDPSGEFPGWNQSTADAAAAAIGAISPGTSLLTLMSPAMSLTGCRLEVREDSDDSLIGIAEYTRPSPIVGAGLARMAAQAAVVVSVRTDTPGGSGRGRIYWPAPGGTLSTSLRLSTPTPTATLADMKTYLLAIRSALATAWTLIGFDLAVRSKTTHTTPHATRLQLGDIVDTQRRRRDNLPESYVSSAFP